MNFRSDKQRRAMFANMSSGGNVKFSFGPKKRAKVVDEIMVESGDIDRTTHLGNVGDRENILTDIVYDDEKFTGGDGVSIEFVPTTKTVGVSLGDHADPLGDYFNVNKERIEKSRGGVLDGVSTVIEVDGDRVFDIRPDKKSRREDVVKFSMKGVRELASGVENMVFFPGALSYNPITVFDDDWEKFEKGEIF